MLTTLVRAAFLLLALGLPGTILAQFTPEEKATLQLLAERAAYAPGAKVRLRAQVEVAAGWHTNSHTPTYDYLIPTELTLELPPGSSPPDVRYPAHQMMSFAFTDEPIAVYDGKFNIDAEFSLPKDLVHGPLALRGALRYQACDDQQCLPPVSAEDELEIEIGKDGPAVHPALFAPPPPVAGTPAAGTPASASLLVMVLLAMLGGLLLNAMPCVLPVLSIKLFGLVKSGGMGRAHLVSGALATTAGILVSFGLLAVLAILARTAGAAVGWGVQFQEPGFVTFLLVVVVLFSLNLWGLFEIPLPQSLARAAGASVKQGAAGHFLSGLFATLMATPCSAPFLGTAVGFALAQPGGVILAIFTAVGIGLALPYLLIAAVPQIAARLPKPGPWMATLKGVMGFLLAGSAVWLFYVLAAQIPAERIALIQLMLLAMALATWALAKTEHGSPGRWLALSATLAAAVLSVVLAAGSSGPATAAGRVASSQRIDWIAFDEAQAHLLAQEGRLVFVDVTADWCLTCKATERLVIETDAVAAAFARHEVVAMKADWTNRDDRITAFLARFGRSAVPFYVLFRPQEEPQPLGELLTQERLLIALETARQVASLPATASHPHRDAP